MKITWSCEICGADAEWISLEHGELQHCKQIYVFNLALGRSRQPQRENMKIMSAAEAIAEGDRKFPRAHWQVRCEDHVSDQTLAYEIDVPRINTRDKLLQWTAHLLGKGWLFATDWEKLLWPHLQDVKLNDVIDRQPRQRSARAAKFPVTICYLCHKELEEPIEQDHVLPVSKGGFYGVMMPVHRECNRRKRDKPWF